MSIDAIDRILNDLDEIHSCPAVVQRILQLTAAEDYEVPAVAACLANDPALSASILRLVNSSLYGLQRKVAGLDQAAMYLGRRALRLSVLNFGVVERFLAATPAEMFTRFWRHALTSATAARLSVGQVGIDREAEDEAYTAGLLGDLGVLVLSQSDPQRYIPLFLECPYHGDLASTEQERYGFNHAQVTARLLQRWALPTHLSEVIGEHTHFIPDSSILQQAVYLASLMSDALWTRDNPHMPRLREVATNAFEMDLDAFVSLALACKDAYTDAQTLFRLQLAGEIDIDALKKEARRQFTALAFDAAVVLDSVDAVTDDHVVIREDHSGAGR